MPRAKTSPHYSYSQPLLQAMMALTNGQPNVKVKNLDVTKKTCEIMGTSIDALGVYEQTGQPLALRYATLAMLDHKTNGLMDFPVKGWWVLTPKACNQASFQGPQPDPVAAEPAPAPAPVSVPADLLIYTPETVATRMDAYFTNLMMDNTPCFGRFSSKSSVCKGCVLSASCFDKMLTTMASLANLLPLALSDEVPQAEEPAPSRPILSALNPSVVTTMRQKSSISQDAFMEMTMAGAAVCSFCTNEIAKGELAAYRRSTGFAHRACVAAARQPAVTP